MINKEQDEIEKAFNRIVVIVQRCMNGKANNSLKIIQQALDDLKLYKKAYQKTVKLMSYNWNNDGAFCKDNQMCTYSNQEKCEKCLSKYYLDEARKELESEKQ